LGKWFGEEHLIEQPLRPEHLEGEALEEPGKPGEVDEAA
jgi:hypothetical protein